jgi:hypothetical protein
MTLEQKAKQVIENIQYVTIASITPEGLPWNTPVFSAFDNQFNFFWNSWKENQHSLNIANEPRIFLVIYNSSPAEGASSQGVYIQARAEMLTDRTEIETARVLLQKRKSKPSSKLRATEEFTGEYPRRIYKAVPERMWLNGDGEVNGSYVDKRIEVDVETVLKV